MAAPSSLSPIRLETARLELVPLGETHAPDHDKRECALAEKHWAAHGFGPWAVLHEAAFAGVVEVHYAYPGVTGITTDEIEVGWWIAPALRGRGLATEATRAVIDDAWLRSGCDHLVAYIRPENAASLRVVKKLGFVVRADGRTRSGDPMTVFELRRP